MQFISTLLLACNMASTDDILLKNLSVRIKYHRKLKGLTQAEVAHRMGMEDGNYRKFENGGNPTYLTLERFCKAIGTTMEELFLSQISM